MTNFGKTAILLATIVALGHGLDCRECPIDTVDRCSSGEDVTCASANDQCFRGLLEFGERSEDPIIITGCLSPLLCNQTFSEDTIGVNLPFEFSLTTTCCTTDGCNSATSIQLSIAMVICGSIFSLWVM